MKNILVLTYWSFKEGLIQSYTLPYLLIISKYLNGGKIFLVSLEKENMKLNEKERKDAKEFLESHNIIHIPLPYRSLSVKGAIRWFKDLFALSNLIRRENVTHIHAWCTPAGMIGVFLSRVNNIPLNLDSFEPHAEAMVENGSWPEGSIQFRIMFYFERVQVKMARHVIATTKGMYNYTKTKYGFDIPNFYVKPACVNLSKFKPGNKMLDREKIGINGEIICVYAGKLGGIYLDKEVFQFFKRAEMYWKDNFKVMLLTNHSDKEIENWINSAELDPKTIIKRFVPFSEINTYLSAADFGITPVKPVPSKKYCTPIKDGEYWATGLPVVITKDISNDSDIIARNKIGFVLENLSEAEYDKAISRIDELIRKDGIKEKIRDVAVKERSFEIAEKVYKNVYG